MQLKYDGDLRIYPRCFKRYRAKLLNNGNKNKKHKMINEEIAYRCIDWPDLEQKWATIYWSPWTPATVFKSIIDKVPAVIYNPACLFHLFQSPNTSWLEALNMFYTSEGAGIMTVFSIYFIWKHSIISCIRKGQSNSELAIDYPCNVVKHFMHIFGIITILRGF